MKEDGNIVLRFDYNDIRKIKWASNTFLDNPYLVLQNDGNLVLYGRDGNAYWASR